MLKLFLFAALSLGILGCSTTRSAMSGMSVSMMGWNSGGHSFVSRDMAGRLALLIVSEKYPRNFFVSDGSVEVSDEHGFWAVRTKNALLGSSFKASLPMIDGVIVPATVTVKIRKTTGEVVDML